MEKEFLGHLSGLKSIAVNSKDGILATGAKVYLFIQDGSGRLWNKDNFKFKNSLNGHKDNVCSIAFCPGEKLIATGAWD